MSADRERNAVPSPAPRAGMRLALFYAASFTVTGVMLPFWPVWLKERGLEPAEIGIVFALTLAIKVVAAPVAAHIADRLGMRRLPLIVMASGALLSFLLFWPAHGFWPLFAVSVLFALFWTAILPLTENLTMLTVVERNLDYGRIRLWGSLSFIAAAFGAGAILDGRSDEAVFFVLALCIAATAAASTVLPDVRPPKASSGGAPIRRLLAQPAFVLLLISGALIQSSHAVYYAFATIHWREAGHGDKIIGALWAEGVIAEIILFVVAAAAVRKIGVARLLALAGAAGMLRWGALAETTALPALVAVQALHAFTYGAAHLATIEFIRGNVPPSLSASAQGLYAAVVYGIGSGLAMMASGWLYGSLNGDAFWIMAAMAGGAFLTALLLARVSRPHT